jgi:prophage regulatory protein
VTDTILKLTEVKAITRRSRSSIYAAIAENDFPQPIKIGKRSVGWIECEIAAWVEARKTRRSGV